jgi:putative spermidine/putrescine transport system ATP-binding protein
MERLQSGVITEGQPFLSIRGLRKEYADHVAVHGMDLEIRKAELVAFLGPSGCGKTTTLRMIAGLLEHSSGKILVGGQDLTAIPTHRRNIGLVFQSYALFPHMTVAENIAFGLRMRGTAKAEIRPVVRDVLEMVGLSGLSDRKPKDLSGGQQQRVALARAVVTNPQLLLLDEPLSNLDARMRDKLRVELRELQQRLGMTAIFVTHDQIEALCMCDRIVVMNEGRIEQVGTPLEIYEQPATPFVASFVGRVNRWKAHMVGGEIESKLGAMRGPQPLPLSNGPVEIMVRPHRIAIGADRLAAGGRNACAGRVISRTFVGDLLQFDVDVNGQRISVEQPTLQGGMPAAVGDNVTLSWSINDTLVFKVAA